MEGLRPPTFDEFAEGLPVSAARAEQLYPVALKLSRRQFVGWTIEIDLMLEEFSGEIEPIDAQE